MITLNSWNILFQTILATLIDNENILTVKTFDWTDTQI